MLKAEKAAKAAARKAAKAGKEDKESAKDKKDKKGKKEEEEEATVGDGALQEIDEGTLKFAVCRRSRRGRLADVKMEFSISLFGKIIFEDQTLELTYGHRYGLVAQNGSGKSTFLKVVAARQIPIPDFIDIWFLDHEAEPSDRSAKDFVIDTVRLEKERLEKLEEDIMSEVGPEDPRLEAIYEKLDKLDPSTFDKRAGELLYGLGFSQQMMSRATKDMSGGWRMRVALAQALFVKPMLLVLDEPTNHLDLGACVWLEDYLAKWESCLLMTSHSQDFLNGVCSKVYHLTVDRELKLCAPRRAHLPRATPLRASPRAPPRATLRAPRYLLARHPCAARAPPSRDTLRGAPRRPALRPTPAVARHSSRARAPRRGYGGNYDSYVRRAPRTRSTSSRSTRRSRKTSST